MPSDEVRGVVLYEDAAHEAWLRALTRDNRRLRFERCGDSTRVLAAFEREVRVLRSKAHQRNLGVLAMIDGDAIGRGPAPASDAGRSLPRYPRPPIRLRATRCGAVAQ